MQPAAWKMPRSHNCVGPDDVLGDGLVPLRGRAWAAGCHKSGVVLGLLREAAVRGRLRL